jgi:hypothetical protein
MEPEQRLKLLRRFCLFVPFLSAASIALLALTPLNGWIVSTVQAWIPGVAPILSAGPFLGWLVLTIGCSAFTAVGLARRRQANSTSTAFVVLVIIGTILVFLAHLIVIGTVAFAGCMIAFNH